MRQEQNACSPVTVRHTREGDQQNWDAYVQAHPRSTFFHQTGWTRVLERTFGYPNRSLLAESEGRVRGILPLFRCRSLRGRASLYSLPHTVYGGPVGDNQEVESGLLEAARRIAASEGAGKIEFRNRYPTLLDLPPVPGFVTFEKDLPATPDLCYRTLPKKSREAINQATKRHKLEAEFTRDLSSFYDLLAASYHNLGTPVFPKSFFSAILREFPDASSILLVRHEGKPVSGVLSTAFRGTMMPLYSGEAPDAGHLKPNNFKYLRLMEHAVEQGFHRFDFGRSRLSNEGTVRFKIHQGFEATPLPYQVDAAGPGTESDSADPNRGFYARARKWWNRLPRGVARVMGPHLIRYFP